MSKEEFAAVLIALKKTYETEAARRDRLGKKEDAFRFGIVGAILGDIADMLTNKDIVPATVEEVK